MARSSPNYFSLEVSGHKFEILPTVSGGYYLVVDGQKVERFLTPESAVQACHLGEITAQIDAKDPYTVSTADFSFPDSLAKWEWDIREPVEDQT